MFRMSRIKSGSGAAALKSSASLHANADFQRNPVAMNAAAHAPVRLTEFSHGGGCGCKIAPGVLSELLAATPMRNLPKDLLVGRESGDDGAVYRVNDTQALTATT